MLFLSAMSNFAMSSLMIAQGKPLLGLACTVVGFACLATDVVLTIRAIRDINRSTRNDR